MKNTRSASALATRLGPNKTNQKDGSALATRLGPNKTK